MTYQLRDKEPRTLRDAFRIAINIQNNLRILGRLERKRDDPRLFGNKENRKEENKAIGGKKQQLSKISQILNAIKGLNLPQMKNDRNPTNNRAPYQSNFNRKNRLKNFPYSTTWKDGQHNMPPSMNNSNKVTPDPLSKNSINLVDDHEFVAKPTWCFACQLPHSPKSCGVALSFPRNQTAVENCHEQEENNDDVGCNMFESHYSNYEYYDRDVYDQRQFWNVIQQQSFYNESDVENNVCDMVNAKEEVTLRKPSREEIDQITTNMIAQVQTRNMAQRDESNKLASIFIKGADPKKGEIVKPKEAPAMKVKITNRRWEQKKGRNPKDMEFSNNVPRKIVEKVSKIITKHDKNHQNALKFLDKQDEKRNVTNDDPLGSSIDMLAILSHITVKVPLSELLRILEHQNKAIAWLRNTDIRVSQDCNENHSPKESTKEEVKENEAEGVVSQIPQIFLDNSVNQCLGNVEPFFLSILVNGKTLKKLHD